MNKVFKWVFANQSTTLLFAMVAVLGYQALEIRGLKADVLAEKDQARVVGIVAENARAAAESNMRVADQWRQRAVQSELESDSLATVLEETILAQATVTITPEPVTATTPAQVGPEYAVADYIDEQLAASVRIKLVDQTAEWRFAITPIPLTVTARCGPLSEDTGVYPALITVEAQRLPTVITEAVVDPSMCNPVEVLPMDQGGSFLSGLVVGAGAVLGVALFIF